MKWFVFEGPRAVSEGFDTLEAALSALRKRGRGSVRSK